MPLFLIALLVAVLLWVATVTGTLAAEGDLIGTADVGPAVLLGLAGVPYIVALVEVLKRLFQEPRQPWPAVTLLVALLVNVAFGYALGQNIVVVAAIGIVAGLAASGLYSGTKRPARE